MGVWESHFLEVFAAGSPLKSGCFFGSSMLFRVFEAGNKQKVDVWLSSNRTVRFLEFLQVETT